MTKCCNGSYLHRWILGLLSSGSPTPFCPEYCVEVGSITELPNVDACPSLLAFVNNAPDGGYGGFENIAGVWTSIFTITEIRYSGELVELIKGDLLHHYEIEIYGQWFTSDQAGLGINFVNVFHEPLPLPLSLTYKIISTGCELTGQVISQ